MAQHRYCTPINFECCAVVVRQLWLIKNKLGTPQTHNSCLSYTNVTFANGGRKYVTMEGLRTNTVPVVPTPLPCFAIR